MDFTNGLTFPSPIVGSLIIEALTAVVTAQKCQLVKQEEAENQFLIGQSSIYIKKDLIVRVGPDKTGLIIDPTAAYDYLTIEHHFWPGAKADFPNPPSDEQVSAYLGQFQVLLMTEISNLVNQSH